MAQSGVFRTNPTAKICIHTLRPAHKTPVCLNFSLVCPEPVLVNRSLERSNGSTGAIFAPPSRRTLTTRSTLHKRCFRLGFPYVCPEPVLVTDHF